MQVYTDPKCYRDDTRMNIFAEQLEWPLAGLASVSWRGSQPRDVSSRTLGRVNLLSCPHCSGLKSKFTFGSVHPLLASEPTDFLALRRASWMVNNLPLFVISFRRRPLVSFALNLAHPGRLFCSLGPGLFQLKAGPCRINLRDLKGRAAKLCNCPPFYGMQKNTSDRTSQ